MAHYKTDIVDIDLATGNIHRSFAAHTIGYKDDDADRFGIRAYRNGNYQDLTGASCQAVFMAADGTKIALTSYGSVVGNEAYVTLPPACYNVEGQFCLAIKVVGGGVTSTLRIVDGVVCNTGATGAVAPTSSVPTYQEIIALYNEMNAVTAAANEVRTAMKLISPTKYERFITFANDTVDVSSFSTNENYKCYVVGCQEGDVFTVSAEGGTNALAYGFVDSEGGKLAVAPENYNACGIVLTAPENAAYLVINDKGGHDSYYGDIGLFLQGEGVLGSSHAQNGVTLDMLTNGVWQVGAAFYAGDSAGTTATKTPRDIVISGQGYHLLAVKFSAGAYVQIAVTYGLGNTFIRRAVSGSWTDWDSVSGIPVKYAGDYLDFDDMTVPGHYYMSSTKMNAIANAPANKNIAECFVLKQSGGSAANDYIQQMLFYPETGSIMTRVKKVTQETWTAWVSAGLSFDNSVATAASLDDIVKTGFYYITKSRIAELDAPCKYSSQMMVLSPGNADGVVSQIIFDTRAGRIFERKLLLGTWTDWAVIEQTTSNGMTWKYDFDNDTVTDTWEAEWEAQLDPEDPGRPNLIASNTGIDIRVGTYNVAAYSYKVVGGNAAHLYDLPEKLLNVRKFVAQGDFDILALQEDVPYIDADSERSASKYIYYDRLPARTSGNAKIRSKRPFTVSRTVEVQTVMDQYYTKDEPTTLHTAPNRNFSWGMMQIGGKNVLVFSCHPRNSYGFLYNSDPTNGPVKDRKNFLQIVFDLVYCLKHPEIYEGVAEDVTAPWDYVIVCGDMNTSNINGQSTAEGYPAYDADGADFDNLCELRDYYSFDSANGGYLNWFVTHRQNGGSSLDNILVSGNVMLKNIDANYENFSALYSDHIPIETTMTLLSQADNPDIDLLRFPEKTYEGKDYTDSSDLSALRTWLAAIMTGTIQHPCT